MTLSTDQPFSWGGLRDRLVYELRRLVQPPVPATAPGMGALASAAGTSFRVWAPHADHVFVSGSFNGWSAWRTPLAPDGNGCWSVDVAAARAGDTYKYLIHYGHERLVRTDPYARDVAPPHRNSVVVAPPAARTAAGSVAKSFQPPARSDLVIYELHVGTFSQDPARPVGTFGGVIERLPYLEALGINAIEIMPVAEFAGDYSWGYNPAQPFAVTRTYGGRERLRQLVEAAHAHGIAVILDVVYNHFGPQDLDLWRFDGWHENGQGGIYFYNDWRAKTPWADTRPDYGRAAVRRYIQDNVMMWLCELGVDGLRWDATNYIRNAHGGDADPGADIAEGWQLMQAVNEATRVDHPGRLMVAEDLQQNAWLTRPVADGGAGFDAQWDAAFVHPVRQAIITPQDEERDMTAVAAALTARYNDDPFARVVYTESHDEVANGKARVPEEIAPGDAGSLFARKRAALGAILMLTSPGVPMLFQGQEFLADKWFDDHVPLDWARAEANAGTVAMYRALIRLRRNLDGCSRGLAGAHINVFHAENEEKILAYHRWDQGGPRDDVVVVVNFANRSVAGYSIGFPRAGIWRVRFNSDDGAYDRAFGGHRCPDVVAAPTRRRREPLDGMPCWGNVTLAPYAALILSQEA